MWSRRTFLRATGLGSAGAALRINGLDEVTQASAAVAAQSPDAVAANEDYWREIQLAFSIDRTLINLNNGHHCPQPRVVQEAVRRYLDMEYQAPVHYAGLINRNHETTRRRLAAEFNCDPEEMAVTRNASESLQILQNGLDLQPGDQVITTDQDYPRMLTTWEQRRRRDQLTITRLQFPVPTTADDLYERFEKAITPKTKVLHFCHITNLTGQLFPVQRLSRLARARGILTIVDGAHAGAHFPVSLRDLECDTYSVSLHKWLLAPLGTGLLYVRRDLIPRFWPLQAANATADSNIRKFEEIGTAAAATRAAINEALLFHQAIGAERKAARLRYLTLRWANRLKQHPRIQMLSNLDVGQTWGMAAVGLQGMDAQAVTSALWDRYRIIVAALRGGRPPAQAYDYQGIRVTTGIHMTLEEIDTFATAMEDLAKTS